MMQDYHIVFNLIHGNGELVEISKHPYIDMVSLQDLQKLEYQLQNAADAVKRLHRN